MRWRFFRLKSCSGGVIAMLTLLGLQKKARVSLMFIQETLGIIQCNFVFETNLSNVTYDECIVDCFISNQTSVERFLNPLNDNLLPLPNTDCIAPGKTFCQVCSFPISWKYNCFHPITIGHNNSWLHSVESNLICPNQWVLERLTLLEISLGFKKVSDDKKTGVRGGYADVLLCKVPLNSSFILLSL